MIAPFETEIAGGWPAADRFARQSLDQLYRAFFAGGVEYFLPGSTLDVVGPAAASDAPTPTPDDAARIEIEWFGLRYRLTVDTAAATPDQVHMIDSIQRVLWARYNLLFDATLAAQRLQMFRGLPEDHYISAFLDPVPYAHIDPTVAVPDRILDAIEVLRVSALTTYENRGIETGVLLGGSPPDERQARSSPADSLPYAVAITEIRSFHRLCDGLHTLALVDRSGRFVELIDVHDWAAHDAGLPLPVPTIDRYAAHARATLRGGRFCLVLTPHGEIKIFGRGAQVFSFLDGRWRLTDAREKYDAWRQAIGDDEAAERLFAVALDLAEERRGALFLILDDSASVRHLLAEGDLLAVSSQDFASSGKQRLHYLLRDAQLLRIAPAVLKSLASIDGATVFDASGALLAFGAILRVPNTADFAIVATEGGRTTAALSASHFGRVLMVSEDGRVSFFHHGRRVWQI